MIQPLLYIKHTGMQMLCSHSKAIDIREWKTVEKSEAQQGIISCKSDCPKCVNGVGLEVAKQGVTFFRLICRSNWTFTHVSG